MTRFRRAANINREHSAQMGNSEVGHLNIGAGRIGYMDIPKIDVMIENGEFLFGKVRLCHLLRQWRRGISRI